ncbi:hypothetical protein, partial [Paenibacillus odorifer]|uniref:hypothetical protein n=1 Tax=Paenibacillus odorifer TaxID=189426 RepID=UPI001C4D7961
GQLKGKNGRTTGNVASTFVGRFRRIPRKIRGYLKSHEMAAGVPSNFGDFVWSTVAEANALAIVYLSSSYRPAIVQLSSTYR